MTSCDGLGPGVSPADVVALNQTDNGVHFRAAVVNHHDPAIFVTTNLRTASCKFMLSSWCKRHCRHLLPRSAHVLLISLHFENRECVRESTRQSCFVFCLTRGKPFLGNCSNCSCFAYRSKLLRLLHGFCHENLVPRKKLVRCHSGFVPVSM